MMSFTELFFSSDAASNNIQQDKNNASNDALAGKVCKYQF
jgi:hypothetical protein